jgi:hypothetical protein
VAPGERVYALTGRIPALYIAALGSWKYRAVFCTAAIMIDAGQHPSTAFM